MLNPISMDRTIGYEFDRVGHFSNHQAKFDADTHKASQVIYFKLAHGIPALFLYGFDAGAQFFGDFTR